MDHSDDVLESIKDTKDATLSITGDTEKSGSQVTVQYESLQDGGLQGWLVVFGAWLIQFTGFGYSNAYAVYQDFYTEVFLANKSASTIAWIGSTQGFLLMTLGLVTGRLFDKGHFWPLMISGVAVYIFCNFMLSLCKPGQYYQFILVQGIGFGLGTGLTFTPAMAVIAHHFTSHRKRTIAMTLAASGSSMGGVLLPIMVNHLFQNPSVGFANGVRAIAGMIAGLQIIALCIMRTKYPPRDKNADARRVGLVKALKTFCTDPAYVCAVLGLLLLATGFLFPLIYFQLFSLTRSVDPSLSLYMISIANVGSLIGRATSGVLAHYTGVPNYLVFSVIAVSGLMFAMLGLHQTSTIAVFGVIFGWFSGTYVALQAPLLAMLARSQYEVGARIGIGFAMQGVGTLIGTPISGQLIGATLVWWKGIVFSGVLCAVGSAFFVVCRILMQNREALSGVVMSGH